MIDNQTSDVEDQEDSDEQSDSIMQPKWEGGVPYCRDVCCQYDTGVCCLLLNEEVQSVCIPAVRTLRQIRPDEEVRDKLKQQRLDAWAFFAAAILGGFTLSADLAAMLSGDPTLGTGDSPIVKPKIDIPKISAKGADLMLLQWEQARFRIFER